MGKRGPTGFAMRPERRRGKNPLWSQNKMSRNYRGRCSIAALRPLHPLCSPLIWITFRKTRHRAKSAAKNHREDRKTGPFMSTNAFERREGVSTGCYNKHSLSADQKRRGSTCGFSMRRFSHRYVALSMLFSRRRILPEISWLILNNVNRTNSS